MVAHIRTAIVTGGSRGLGRALVRTLANAGWTVVTDARDGYATAFQAIVARLAGIDAILTDITFAEARGAALIYHATRTDAGVVKLFEVRFVMDTDGIWRVEAF